MKINPQINPKDYKLLWTDSGFDVFRADIDMSSLDQLQTLSTVRNGKLHCYIPYARTAWAEKAGLEKLSNARAFDDHMIEFKEFYTNNFPELKKLANNPTRENVKTFIDNSCRICWYYSQISIAHTNGITLELLQDKNSLLAQTLEKAGEFKNFTRQWFNQIMIHEDCLLITLLENLSEKFEVSTTDLGKYKYSELPELFDGKKVPEDEIAARDDVVFYYNTTTAKDITYITGASARQIIDAFAKHNAVAVATTSTNGIRGLVGCTANMIEIEGTAYLLEIDHANPASTNAQIEKMPDGHILVVEFTEPDFFTACKKSSAMVTDIGGILSHTAIVSRELNIPAIVGTKNATKLIKTGDRIKLNLTTGEVSVL